MKSKVLIQRGIKEMLCALAMVQPPRRLDTAFLIYHSASGRLPLELDLPPQLLEQQLAYLAATKRVISYDHALAFLDEVRDETEFRSDPKDTSRHPTYVLTFDDGYLDFYTTVFPLLQRWQLPAILFVTTGFVEERVAYPMLSYPQLDVEPVTWEMLGEMAASGLVTLGAHTHTHAILPTLHPEQMAEELVRPLDIFERELGIVPQHFCYPQARWDPMVEMQVKAHYQTAVVGGGGWANRTTFVPYRIPRIPVRRSDGWRYFQAKITGQMMNEEALYNWLRRRNG